MRGWYCVVALGLLAGGVPAEPVPVALAGLVAGQNGLALNLLRGQSADKGAFLSPYSLHQALVMLYVGARGQSRASLAKALGVNPDDDSWLACNAELATRLVSEGNQAGARWQVANGLFCAALGSVPPAYISAATQATAGGEVLALDLERPEAARLDVNRWVAEKTDQEVLDLLPAKALTAQSSLALASAALLRADWREPFAAGNTTLGVFDCLNQSRVRLPLMRQQSELAWAKRDNWQAVGKALGPGLRALFILPEGATLAALEASLTPDRLAALRTALRPAAVDLTLPMFAARQPIDVRATLTKLGLGALFGPDANLSGIGSVAYLHGAWHRAVLRTQERGVVASAVVAPSPGEPAPPTGVDLRVAFARPFLVLIEDSATGVILYIGRIANPGGEPVKG